MVLCQKATLFHCFWVEFQPTKKHLTVKDFITPQEFKDYEIIGKRMGFRHVESGPLVRSSYKAHKHIH